MNFGKSVRESVKLCVTTLEEITAAEKELAAARKAGNIAPADAEAKSAELARARADAWVRSIPGSSATASRTTPPLTNGTPQTALNSTRAI